MNFISIDQFGFLSVWLKTQSLIHFTSLDGRLNQ